MSALWKGAIALGLMVGVDAALAAAGMMSWMIVVAGIAIAAVEGLKIFLVTQRFGGSGSNKEGMGSLAVEVATFLLVAVLLFVIANPMEPANKHLAIAYCVNFMVARVVGYLAVRERLS